MFRLFVGVVCSNLCQVLTVSKRCAVCLTFLIHDVKFPFPYSATKLNILFPVSAVILLYSCFFQFLTIYSTFRHGVNFLLNVLSITFLSFLYLT